MREKVEVKEIPYQVAKAYNKMYHSYMNGRHNSSVRHGIFYESKGMVGLVEYAYLLCSEDIAGYSSNRYMEIARICFHTEIKNLTSCGLMKSVRKFKDEYARENDVELLVTYVRDDYRGKICEACSFEFDGISQAQTSNIKSNMAGNRPFKEIYTKRKKRYTFEL